MRKFLILSTLCVTAALLGSCGTDIEMPEDKNGSVIYVSPADQSETEANAAEETTTAPQKADMKFYVSIN